MSVSRPPSDNSSPERTRPEVASFAAVVDLAQASPAPTLRAIFEQTAPRLLRFLRYLGVNEGELDDALQEVFVIAHRRMSELREQAKLEPWLRAIALNVARNQRRARGRRREQPSAEPIEIVAQDGPYEDLERRRARAQLAGLLEQLTDEQRAVVVLYEIEQLPMREVAESLDCPLQTAYSRLHAAREALRRAWASSPEGQDG